MGTLSKNESSVFQAEILAIMKTVVLLRKRELTNSMVAINIDSQVAMKAVASVEVGSRLIDRREEN